VFKKEGETTLPVLIETVVVSGSDALVRGTLRAGDTIAAQVPSDWSGPDATGAAGTTNTGEVSPTTDTL
jgi:hypothetical protein